MSALPDPQSEAEDKRLRSWIIVGAGGTCLVAVLIGLLILPIAERSRLPGLDAFAAICRAIGLQGFGPALAALAPVPPARLASDTAWTAATRSVLARGDAKRGEALATEVCAPCHGKDGIGTDVQFPNLAGQPPMAIFKELADYRGAHRSNEFMAAIIPQLDEKKIADAAAYYGGLEPIARHEIETAVSGAIITLVESGDPARAIPACISCHGSSRDGPLEAPNLAGQSAEYISKQLTAFADQSRHNDLFARMRNIAAALHPDEIKGLAVYYRGAPIPEYRN